MSNGKKTIFEGCATALMTPFRNGEIDFYALKNLIRRQLDGKVDALVVAGTTGESPTLFRAERELLFRAVVSEVAGAVPVIAGTGSNDTRHTVIFSQQAQRAGCDALLVVSPYYNKGTEEGLYRHYMEIAGSVSLPIMLYNVPSRTGSNIPVPVLKRLSRKENIVGIKEASGQLNRCGDIAAACGDKLPMYSGNDDITVPLMSIGGKGVVSVISNLLPLETHQMCMMAKDGDYEGARRVQLWMMPLISALFAEVNPVPVKCAAQMLGLCEGDVRLPLTPAAEATKKRLETVMHSMGLL